MVAKSILISYLDKLLDGLQVNEIFSLPSKITNAFQMNDGVRNVIQDAVENASGHLRRRLMAMTVNALGKGGQRMAEQELGWNRGTIRKGIIELQSGIRCVDNFSGRGRNASEENLPNLLEDITVIVKPTSQTDPTFRTTKLYTPLTAKNVYKRLLEQKKYTKDTLPTIRTISTKLNNLNFHPQKVKKTKPVKKIKETDAIFRQVHKINKKADETDGVLRISMDAKAKVNIGDFSRGGKSRQGEKSSDHDYEAEHKLTPFDFFLPFYDESYFYFSKSKVTADFMIDCLQDLWINLQQRFNPHTLTINLDNGPENSSHRTQFIKRTVDFAHNYGINIKLAYYPPYHSKYNPVERVWGVLENHWNGEILYSIEKALGLARTMTYNGINPVVKFIEKEYQTGIKLDKKTMNGYEEKIIRLQGLEHWFVDIPI